jgi:hypothetical protein
MAHIYFPTGTDRSPIQENYFCTAPFNRAYVFQRFSCGQRFSFRQASACGYEDTSPVCKDCICSMLAASLVNIFILHLPVLTDISAELNETG